MKGKVSLLALGSVTVLMVTLFVFGPLPVSSHFDQPIDVVNGDNKLMVYFGGLVDLNSSVGDWWAATVTPTNWSYPQHCWFHGFNMTFSAADSVTGIVDITVEGGDSSDWHTIWDDDNGAYWSWNLPLIDPITLDPVDGVGQIYTGEGSSPVYGDVEMNMSIIWTGTPGVGYFTRRFKNSTGHWNDCPTAAEMAANTGKYIGDGIPETEFGHSWLWLPMMDYVYLGQGPPWPDPPGSTPTVVLQYQVDNEQWWNTKYSEAVIDYPGHPLDGIVKRTTDAEQPPPAVSKNGPFPWNLDNGTVFYGGCSGYIDEQTTFGANTNCWISMSYLMVGSEINKATGDWTGDYCRYVGDVDDDNVVFTVDLGVFAKSWGGQDSTAEDPLNPPNLLDTYKRYWYPMNETAHPGKYYTSTDFDGDGKVFTVDLGLFAKNWGKGLT